MTDRVDTEAITARLTAYNKHKNDPYAYYEGEIEAVRELRRCAPGDIAALLAEVARLRDVLEKTRTALKPFAGFDNFDEDFARARKVLADVELGEAEIRA